MYKKIHSNKDLEASLLLQGVLLRGGRGRRRRRVVMFAAGSSDLLSRKQAWSQGHNLGQ